MSYLNQVPELDEKSKHVYQTQNILLDLNIFKKKLKKQISKKIKWEKGNKEKTLKKLT